MKLAPEFVLGVRSYTLLTFGRFLKYRFYYRWDTNVGSIVESRLKELHPIMPVMYIRALTNDKQETRNFYECPVYKTRQRGPTYIWTFNLRSREKATKWILAGACLILQI